jgi:hypothetical protein
VYDRETARTLTELAKGQIIQICRRNTKLHSNTYLHINTVSKHIFSVVQFETIHLREYLNWRNPQIRSVISFVGEWRGWELWADFPMKPAPFNALSHGDL